MATGHYIYIKNMVCDRCIMAVRQTLVRLGLTPVSIVLGRAELAGTPTAPQRSAIGEALAALGFELLDGQRARTAEQIRQLIIAWVRQPDKRLHVNLSQHLAEQCHHDYSTLSKLFSEMQGTTIEKYFITQKIERAKELLEYNELSLNEIADRLGYSSTAYLSTQFKSLTGLTPRQYKQQKDKRRIPLVKV